MGTRILVLAHLLWTSGFEQTFLKNTFKDSQRPGKGQSNTSSWEPIQAVRPSVGRLLSWNLASSEMPNCSKGSCGGVHADCEQGQGRATPPHPYTPCLSSS